jgi:hypothetical protein
MYLREKLQRDLVPLLANVLNEQVSLGRPGVLQVGKTPITPLLLDDPEISEQDGIHIHLGISEE